MAAMDQEKLNSLVSNISNLSEEYFGKVSGCHIALTDCFYMNWISNAAQDFANEIQMRVENVTNEMSRIFNGKNEQITNAVINFNVVEKESIVYRGFVWPSINFSFNLGRESLTGKIGVQKGVDSLGELDNELNTMCREIEEILDKIVSTVKSIDAFDMDEQNALISSVTNIKNVFSSEMTELRSTLKKRLMDDMAEREKLNEVNMRMLSE